MDVDRMGKAERTAYLEEKLRETVSFAYQHAPSVKSNMDAAGVAPQQIRTVKDLEAIPITRKEDILAAQKESPPFGGFATITSRQMERVCVSPGPIFEPLAQLEGGAKGLSVAGFGPDDIVVVTPSFHMVPAGMLYEGALLLTGATVVATGPGNTELQIHTMRQLQATGYVGFPRFLLSIIHRVEEIGHNFRRDFSITKAYIGGEMFTPSMKQAMEDDYGIQTWEHYGTADLGVVAYECPGRSGLHMYEGVIMEVVDPATGKQLDPGQPGEIVVTTFEKDYPLIRYGTGDESFYTDEPCSCGRTIPRLVDILGRVGDAPRVRGLFLVPREVAETVGAFPEVTAFQVAVRLSGLRDEMVMRVEGEIGDKEGFTKSLKARFQDSCRLTLDQVEFVSTGTILQGSKVVVDERKWE